MTSAHSLSLSAAVVLLVVMNEKDASRQPIRLSAARSFEPILVGRSGLNVSAIATQLRMNRCPHQNQQTGQYLLYDLVSPSDLAERQRR
jgi:hypothetical protein